MRGRVKKRGEAPLRRLDKRLFSKGIKRGEAMIRRCSYHNSLPSPLMKGRGIKGKGLVDNDKGKEGCLKMLEGSLASPEDFATLFQYIW